MKLLIEKVEDVKCLVEEVNGKKSMFIEGVFLQAERKNKNGRVYPKSVMEREVARYTKQLIETKRAFGELSHPATPNINLDRVSHIILSLRECGNDYVGKARITDTPMGNIARGLIESGGQLGVSSRGCGSMKKCTEGHNIIQDDYHLATAADIVADPSAPDAFVGALYEGKEWIWNNGILLESEVSAIYNEVKNAKRKDLEEATLRAMKRFFSSL